MRDIFIVLVVVMTGVRWWLLYRQLRHVALHRSEVPDAFASRLTLAEHHKAADYTRARGHVASIAIALEAVMLLWWTVGGGVLALTQWWAAWQLPALVTGTVMIVSWLVIGTLVSLPLRIYRIFVVEARFGFNHTTVATFIKDLLLSAVIGLVIAVPLVYGLLWIMQSLGLWWWVWAWVAFCLFQLLAIWAVPTLISPLFNRFTPLSDTLLSQRIDALLARVGFASSGVFVMDASRRSGHGNAYFTGIGNQKRIVFFDTLLAQLSHGQIEAVLAHELGHYKLQHIPKMIAGAFGLSLIGFAGVDWLLRNPDILAELVAVPATQASTIVTFLVVIPVLTYWMDPVQHWVSRRHEYEADAFAVAHTTAQDMIDALVVLFKENASTLTPDPLYTAWYATHPPTLQRIAHIRHLESDDRTVRSR